MGNSESVISRHQRTYRSRRSSHVTVVPGEHEHRHRRRRHHPQSESDRSSRRTSQRSSRRESSHVTVVPEEHEHRHRRRRHHPQSESDRSSRGTSQRSSRRSSRRASRKVELLEAEHPSNSSDHRPGADRYSKAHSRGADGGKDNILGQGYVRPGMFQPSAYGLRDSIDRNFSQSNSTGFTYLSSIPMYRRERIQNRGGSYIPRKPDFLVYQDQQVPLRPTTLQSSSWLA